MTYKHTPGPWKLAPHGDAVYAAEGGDIVCLSPAHEGWEASERRWPENARLIAAAPDLYSALVELLDASNVPEIMTRQETLRLIKAEDAARAAIKKARGEK